jgi:sugar/nucleoside kinase (ribokinase family)
MILIFGDVIDDILVRPLTAITADSDTSAEIVRRPGGSAANQAAWLGYLGSEVAFVGRVGAADVERHRNALPGVDAHLVPDDAHNTGTIVLMLGENGERTMFTDRGASLNLSHSDIPDSLIRKANHVHLTGYSFFAESTRAATLEILAATQASFSVDPGSVAFLRDVGAERFRDWISPAAACFPNLDEARELTGRDDPEEAASALQRDFPVVAVTLGAAGAVVAGPGLPPTHIPAPTTECVDPTGAGDAFCAGFLHSWLAQDDVLAAARFGVRTAAQAIGRFGARP